MQMRQIITVHCSFFVSLYVNFFAYSLLPVPQFLLEFALNKLYRTTQLVVQPQTYWSETIINPPLLSDQCPSVFRNFLRTCKYRCKFVTLIFHYHSDMEERMSWLKSNDTDAVGLTRDSR